MLNTAWIEQLFALEEEDRRVLGDPTGTIVERGGDVLVARDEATASVVGCVAVIPGPEGRWELTKMAVAEAARGAGLGRRLVAAAVDRARAGGARAVFLGSSTKLADAVHLYETVGFRHVPKEELRMPYARADVFMMLEL